MAPTTPAAPVPLVALRLPNRALAEGVDAQWSSGRAALPLPPDLPAPELEAALDLCRPASLVYETGERPLDRPLPVEAGVAAVVMTSGSTGAPRAVELGRDAMEASAAATNDRLGVTPADRWLCPLPLIHVAGLQVLVRSELAGLEAPVVLDHFDVEAVASADANLVSLVPTMLVRLLDAGVDLSGFKCILLGGASVAPSLIERAEQAGARITRTYGMTETCGGCVYDGKPLDGVSLRIEEGGEISVAGPMLFRRYRGQPGPTARRLQAGWFRTADAGLIEDGRLRVLGRLDELIITGGEKVSPAEVAALLMEHPAVVHAEMVGVPDAEWGESAVAFVQAGDVDADELRAFVGHRAAAFKVPRRVVLVDDWPRLASGKIDRAALAQGIL